ncbi:Na+/H+ antiporter family protein [Laribacter hongkongensis]|uniref:TRAP transporter large permease subunit n=1 Tax=Laribacter hongkongensis TaxID=168471 RepID=A0ABD4SMC8_9NEIS|nr:Na+/H+ antiporter NhaC family protein [Laribacter hongkongensis]MCG9024622.1 TRAP transporter large permease subunit [Laribacter hongkongensis]
MNAVLLAVVLMLGLSLARVNVVISLIVASVAGGLDMAATLKAFNAGIGGGAGVALSYALLGAFALALAQSGLPHALADRLLAMVQRGQGTLLKWTVLGALVLMAISSQNILPIHIAFIPLVVPPLLFVLAKLRLDRRAVACVLTFGLITPYMTMPIGFGEIYLNQILMSNVAKAGLDTSGIHASHAMLIPALGMIAGLLIALFVSYRKPRDYDLAQISDVERESVAYSSRSIWVSVIAVAIAFAVQLSVDSMLIGALAGFLVFVLGGVVKWREADSIFSDGMKMMATIGLVMIAAAGFAEVLKATGEIGALVQASADAIGHSKPLAALLMLLVGLLVTMGIGSSFSTIPILAAIYVPLAIEMGFGPLAIVSLVGTAGALGDAGSPASDSTLGPTAGLNVDGQHNHIWDTVVPTFLHYNLPLLVAGWIAAMVL